jgi:DNA-binding MarR family transcriptional regulator
MADSDTDLENPLEKRLGYQLRRASNAMMMDLAGRLEALNLRIVEASALVLIKTNPAITQTEIGRNLGIQRANMVPLIAGLMERGLVNRQAADGRSHALSLTAAGRGLTTKVEGVMRAHEEFFLAGISAADRGRLARLLGAIRAREERA